MHVQEGKAFYEEKWFWGVIVTIICILAVTKRNVTKVIICGNANGENTKLDLKVPDVLQ